eukprot:4855228-Alexandrium_andersonii.AAC.1
MSYLLCDRHMCVDMYWRQSSADGSGRMGVHGWRSPVGGFWHWRPVRGAREAHLSPRIQGPRGMVRCWGGLPI